ncbi:beta-galactosidase [Oleiharenicola lentus]|uniref:beta-galactosidase n=1 Tax=Oleiharenicola lentus TaxID=2508720 RepID=UPI003F669A13
MSKSLSLADPVPRKLIGAEIWVEPGHTEAQIDGWFRQLAENGLRCARILLVWQYLEKSRGVYDFTLYDWAFRAAEKYHIKLVASLQTDSMPAHWGMPYNLHARYLPKDEAEMKIIADYVTALVTRYKDSPALDTWLHLDENSVTPAGTPLAMGRFRDWLRDKYVNIAKLNEVWRTDFSDFSAIEYDVRWTGAAVHMHIWIRSVPFVDFYTFYREHNTWYLRWVTDRIKEIDPHHGIHNYIANIPGPHAGQSLDLPKWRDFLDTFGCGVHPPWHLGMFAPDQVALGVSLSCEIARGSIEPKPFWLTETQGGSIIYAGMTYPRNLNADDLAQIFWTAIGAGADRVIYWLLNHRLQDYEAGEWGLLDFQNEPTDRLRAIAEATRTLHASADFFEASSPWQTPVTILMSLETETLGLKLKGLIDAEPGKGPMAHLLEAYGIYQALQELGIPARLKFMDDYEWDAPASEHRFAILPHVTTLTAAQAAPIEKFVASGHTLLATGLTGLYDDLVNFQPLTGFALRKVLGGQLRDVRLLANICPLELQSPALTVPAHLWISELRPDDATPIGTQSGWITATQHKFGEGTAYWIPAPIGLGARESKDFKPLASLLRTLLAPHLAGLPVRFAHYTPRVFQRVLSGPGGFVTVHANTGDAPTALALKVNGAAKPTVLWQSPGARISADGTQLDLPGRATVVTRWSE